LTFKVAGTVEDVMVEMGDVVAEGQVLSTLKETSLPASVITAQADLLAAEKALDDLRESSLQLAQAQMALAHAKDALKDAEYMWRVRQEGYRASASTLEAAKARVVIAEDSLEAAKSFYSRVSGDPLESANKAEALLRVTSAQTQLDSAKRALNWYQGRPSEIDQAILDADVAEAQANVQDAQRALDRLVDGVDPADLEAARARVAAAQATVEMARIAAPFAGTITSVDVKPGDLVGAGTSGIGLADMREMLVDVSVSEIDVNRLAPGQEVSLVFDAVPDREYAGEVTEIGLSGTSVEGVVTFPVTVRLADFDDAVRSGMTAAVTVTVNEIKDVLLVPNRAVRVNDGKRVVYILVDGRPTPVAITLGASSDTHSQVVSGDLKEGDLIVLNPPAVFEQNGPPFMMGGN
jgi:HlyD family secretion protein